MKASGFLPGCIWLSVIELKRIRTVKHIYVIHASINIYSLSSEMLSGIYLRIAEQRYVAITLMPHNKYCILCILRQTIWRTCSAYYIYTVFTVPYAVTFNHKLTGKSNSIEHFINSFMITAGSLQMSAAAQFSIWLAYWY